MRCILLLVAVCVMAVGSVSAVPIESSESVLQAETSGTGNGVLLHAFATHYDWPSGGNTCNKKDPMCVAVSDGFDALWTQALHIPTKCSDTSCTGDCATKCCFSGGPKGPGCPYDKLCSANHGSLCVRCTATAAGVCKHKRWIKVSITEACPRYHPCNTCKGSQNPCAEGRATVDLCNAAFNNIASSQPSWQGLPIDISTDLTLC